MMNGLECTARSRLGGLVAALICSTGLVGPGTLAETLPGRQPLSPAPKAQPVPLNPAAVAPPPRLLQPVAPGAVLTRPPLTQPATGGGPEMWTFAHPKAESVSPSSVRLAWRNREGATHFRVYRDDSFLTELPAGVTSYEYLDNSLSPGQRVSYVVHAVLQGTTRPVALPVAVASGSRLVNTQAQALTVVLETSQPAYAVTPSLEVPRDFSVSIPDRNRNQVRVNWSVPKWATSIQILRDGVAIGNADGVATSFDDVGVLSGTHRYGVRSLHAAAPGKVPFASVPSTELSLRIGPFTMVAFGDSIMWGQGLAEDAKFTARVHDALYDALGARVRLHSFAHSGAMLRRAPGPLPAIGQQEVTGFDQSHLITQGEVPNHYPTVLHQINVSAAQTQPPLPHDQVDLVLIDGCINDVSVQVIINPTQTPTSMSNLARKACSGMGAVLQRVHEIFPKAMIVVTGYYPIASEQSDLSALSALVATVTGTAALAAPLVGVPTDPVTAVAAALIGMQSFKTSVVANSTAFASTSDAVLLAAVQGANSRPGSSGLVAFASPGFQPANSYGAPASWLWLIPDLAPPSKRDDVMAERGAVCNTPGVIATAQGAPFISVSQDKLDIERGLCTYASMGHPNHQGAQAYATAIIGALQAKLPHWREEFAATRRAQ